MLRSVSSRGRRRLTHLPTPGASKPSKGDPVREVMCGAIEAFPSQATLQEATGVSRTVIPDKHFMHRQQAMIPILLFSPATLAQTCLLRGSTDHRPAAELCRALSSAPTEMVRYDTLMRLLQRMVVQEEAHIGWDSQRMASLLHQLCAAARDPQQMEAGLKSIISVATPSHVVEIIAVTAASKKVECSSGCVSLLVYYLPIALRHLDANNELNVDERPLKALLSLLDLVTRCQPEYHPLDKLVDAQVQVMSCARFFTHRVNGYVHQQLEQAGQTLLATQCKYLSNVGFLMKKHSRDVPDTHLSVIRDVCFQLRPHSQRSDVQEALQHGTAALFLLGATSDVLSIYQYGTPEALPIHWPLLATLAEVGSWGTAIAALNDLVNTRRQWRLLIHPIVTALFRLSHRLGLEATTQNQVSEFLGVVRRFASPRTPIAKMLARSLRSLCENRAMQNVESTETIAALFNVLVRSCPRSEQDSLAALRVRAKLWPADLRSATEVAANSLIPNSIVESHDSWKCVGCESFNTSSVLHCRVCSLHHQPRHQCVQCSYIKKVDDDCVVCGYAADEATCSPSSMLRPWTCAKCGEWNDEMHCNECSSCGCDSPCAVVSARSWSCCGSKQHRAYCETCFSPHPTVYAGFAWQCGTCTQWHAWDTPVCPKCPTEELTEIQPRRPWAKLTCETCNASANDPRTKTCPSCESSELVSEHLAKPPEQCRQCGHSLLQQSSLLPVCTRCATEVPNWVPRTLLPSTDVATLSTILPLLKSSPRNDLTKYASLRVLLREKVVEACFRSASDELVPLFLDVFRSLSTNTVQGRQGLLLMTNTLNHWLSTPLFELPEGRCPTCCGTHPAEMCPKTPPQQQWKCGVCDLPNDASHPVSRLCCMDCLAPRPEMLETADWLELWVCGGCHRANASCDDLCLHCERIRPSLEAAGDDNSIPFCPAKCGACGTVHLEALCPSCSTCKPLTSITHGKGFICTMDTRGAQVQPWGTFGSSWRVRVPLSFVERHHLACGEEVVFDAEHASKESSPIPTARLDAPYFAEPLLTATFIDRP